jgi:hypothetical protein
MMLPVKTGTVSGAALLNELDFSFGKCLLYNGASSNDIIISYFTCTCMHSMTVYMYANAINEFTVT